MNQLYAEGERLERAKRRVADIKKFYKHLSLFLIVNLLLLLIELNLSNWYVNSAKLDKGTRLWLEWNVISFPLIWFIVLAVHGLYIFKFKYSNRTPFKPIFFKEWEQKELARILEKENH
ncbi:MAG: 2TM domain-containing protein [Maribacter sp.]